MSDIPDQDEKALSELAKRMLSRPPKRQAEMKIGKHKQKGEQKANRKSKGKTAT
jgi:hypothetical protein